MTPHVHMGPVFMISVVAIVLLTLLMVNIGGAKLAQSQNENKQLFGAALGNFA